MRVRKYDPERTYPDCFLHAKRQFNEALAQDRHCTGLTARFVCVDIPVRFFLHGSHQHKAVNLDSTEFSGCSTLTLEWQGTVCGSLLGAAGAHTHSALLPHPRPWQGTHRPLLHSTAPLLCSLFPRRRPSAPGLLYVRERHSFLPQVVQHFPQAQSNLRAEEPDHCEGSAVRILLLPAVVSDGSLCAHHFLRGPILLRDKSVF